MTRVNLNVERLITELAQTNPAAAAQLLPYAQDLMGDASGYQGAPAENSGVPGTVPPDMGAPPPPSAGTLGTPLGGMDGNMYQEPAALPGSDQMYGEDLG
jgi:hypothetical protein